MECISFPAWPGSLVSVFFNIFQKLFEPGDKFGSDVLERGCFIAIYFKVSQATTPVAPVPLRFRVLVPSFYHIAIVFQKRSVLFELSCEGIFTILDFDSAWLLRLGLLPMSDGFVPDLLVSWHQSGKVSNTPCSFAITINIQIKADTAICQFFLAKFHRLFLYDCLFCHNSFCLND